MPRANPVLGVLAALAVVLLWAGFLLLSRHGLRDAIAPVDMAALRFGVSGVVMLPILVLRGTGGLGWHRIAALAFAGGLGFALFVYTGFALAPAAYGAILLPGVLPFYTVVLSWLVLKERLTPAQLPAVALVLSGIAVLALSTLTVGNVDALKGGACFLVGSFSWACFTILLRRWRLEAVQATAVVAVAASVVYMPLYLLLVPSGLPALPWSTLLIQGAYQGIGGVILALMAFTYAVRHLGPSTTTMITAMTPAVVAVGAVRLLGEPLTAPIALGVVAVVVGGILTARAAVRREPKLA